MIPPKKIKIQHDPNDDWAEVELFRWQYGELPLPDDTRKLDIPTSLNKLADALEKRDMNNFPTPAGITSILQYVAKLLKTKA